jgi:peptide deformylase
MANLVYWGDPVLKKPTQKVTFDKANSVDIPDLIMAMTKVMNDENGAGLAANQIGYDVAVCIVKHGPHDVRTYINPEIVESFEPTVMTEGCLSIPGQQGKVNRFKKIRLKYNDVNGLPQDELFEGNIAHALQHEVDHLNGILYVDRLKIGQKMLAMKQHQKISRFLKRSEEN